MNKHSFNIEKWLQEYRSKILETGTNVCKYNIKKDEAEVMLKNTKNNLIRIKDIICEVKRQISRIDRLKLKDDIRQKELKELHDRLNFLLNQKQDLHKAEQSLRKAISKISDTIQALITEEIIKADKEKCATLSITIDLSFLRDEDVANVLTAISDLYRSLGGDSLIIKSGEIFIQANEEVLV